MMKKLVLTLFVLALAAVSIPASAATKKPAAAKKGAKAAAAPAGADAALAAIDAQVAAAKVDKSNAGWKTALPMFKTVAFDGKHQYFVRMATNKGDIVIKMRPDVAPAHVTNFLYLARLGFYDGTKFHRVIKNFMAQGGCPLGSGMGSPGYGFDGEFSPNVKHDRPGLLSMANTGQPKSDGSQFFLTFLPTPWLDGKHTIFGEVVEGMPVVKMLEAAGSQSGQTSEPLNLMRATVEVK